jgi:hypothetical protein
MNTEVMSANSLREVFSLYDGYLDVYSHEREVKLPSLKHVHLHKAAHATGHLRSREDLYALA